MTRWVVNYKPRWEFDYEFGDHGRLCLVINDAILGYIGFTKSVGSEKWLAAFEEAWQTIKLGWYSDLDQAKVALLEALLERKINPDAFAIDTMVQKRRQKMKAFSSRSKEWPCDMLSSNEEI